MECFLNPERESDFSIQMKLCLAVGQVLPRDSQRHLWHNFSRHSDRLQCNTDLLWRIRGRAYKKKTQQNTGPKCILCDRLLLWWIRLNIILIKHWKWRNIRVRKSKRKSKWGEKVQNNPLKPCMNRKLRTSIRHTCELGAKGRGLSKAARRGTGRRLSEQPCAAGNVLNPGVGLNQSPFMT